MKPLKDLVIINEKGMLENCGAIAAKRDIDGTVVYLTFTEPADGDGEGMWWIVWQDALDEHRLKKIGYVVPRREICWQTFTLINAAELAQLRPS